MIGFWLVIMRKISCALLFLFPVLGFAQEVTIESEGLSPAPVSVARLISESQAVYEKSEFPRCTIVGKPLGEGELWFFTVRGCEIGNAAGPVWIVRGAPGQEKILLESNAFSIKTQQTTHHGLPDLLAISSTAATYGDESWEYDGRRYVRGKERIFRFDDPEACKANPDVCKP